MALVPISTRRNMKKHNITIVQIGIFVAKKRRNKEGSPQVLDLNILHVGRKVFLAVLTGEKLFFDQIN